MIFHYFTLFLFYLVLVVAVARVRNQVYHHFRGCWVPADRAQLTNQAARRGRT